jgi:transposase
MTKTQVEGITSVERRRRWSRSEKERIVAAAIEPGAVASEVARAAGIHVSQLFRWRQQLCVPPQSPPSFAAVAIAAPAAEGELTAPAPVPAGIIEIEFATGARMRISGPADPSTVSAMVTALAKAKRLR